MSNVAVSDASSGVSSKKPNSATALLDTCFDSLLRALGWIGAPIELALSAVIAAVPWLLRRVADRVKPGRQSMAHRDEATDGQEPQVAERVRGGDQSTAAGQPAGGVVVNLGSPRLDSPAPALSFLKAAALFVVFTLTWACVVAMQRIDQAVQQMGSAEGSGLGFPWVVGNVLTPAGTEPALAVRLEEVHRGWDAFALNSRPQGATEGSRLFRDPQEIVGSLVGLDIVLMVLYTALFGAAIVMIKGVSAREADAGQLGGLRRRRALLTATGALVMLLAVDVVEDIEIWRVLVNNDDPIVMPGGIGLGSLMSCAKVILGAVVIGTLLVVGAVLAVRWRGMRRAIVATRGVYYLVALLFVLLMVGIGAHQIDDVVRGWTFPQMLLAVLFMTILAGAVRGAVRRLSSIAMGSLQPATGLNSQTLLVGAGVSLIVVGALMAVPGWGWGLVAPGLLLLAIWLVGVTFEGLRRWPASEDQPARAQQGRKMPRSWIGHNRRTVVRGVIGVSGVAAGTLVGWLVPLSGVGCALGGAFVALVVVARVELSKANVDAKQGCMSAQHVEPDADELAADIRQKAADSDIADTVEDFGKRLGRVTGAVVVAMVVVVIARAVALDFTIHAESGGSITPVVGAVLALAVGATVFGHKSSTRPRTFGTWWFLATVVSGFLLLLLAQDGLSIGFAGWLGTMAIVFAGSTFVLGLMTIAASAARQGPIHNYRLPTGLRALGFHGFPTVLFLAAWLLVVSSLDSGGFHNVRTTAISKDYAVPSIGASLKDYLAANPPATGTTAQPVVLVGASGGGIRAAVWTSLVMECLFGPGTVTNSSDVCAVPASASSTPSENAKRPLPVFIASGASGGSVGLATWTARRADLVQDGASAQIPNRVEDMLSGDLVAPLMGRMVTGDLPMAFLAGNPLDRAAILEQGWEAAYRAGGERGDRGLQRGMLETWAQTHRDHAWLSPVLAMHGTSMGDGCRFITSPVDFTVPNRTKLADIDDSQTSRRPSLADKPDDAACRGTNIDNSPSSSRDILPSTNELVDYLCPGQDVPMSTAAHLSARFPYVSPTGRIHTPGCGPGTVPGPAVSYIADGGIFDNAGSGSAVDAWRALAPLAAEQERGANACIVPMFVQIDNSPPTSIVADVTSPDARPMELIAPITASAGQLASREEYARATAAAAFGAPRSAGGQVVTGTDSLFFRVTLRGQPGPEPPLGWTLAPDTVNDMRRQLTSNANADVIRTIRAAVAGSLRCGE